MFVLKLKLQFVAVILLFALINVSKTANTSTYVEEDTPVKDEADFQQSDAPQWEVNKQKSSYQKKYDFIIIGSGPAGVVLANRLSKFKNFKVLLLEAGSAENFVTTYPLSAPTMALTSFNYGYITEPQTNACQGMVDNRCSVPTGKGMGGSTLIDFMTYSRGNEQEYNSWPRGWSYKEVFPYFLKSENANLAGLLTSPYHSTNGPLSVEDVSYRTTLADAYIQANLEAGYPEVDYNGQNQLGVSYIQANTLHGVRQSAASAFLGLLSCRSNLNVITDAQTTKILINPSTKYAYGVQYIKDNKKYTVKSTKEIIVSAGTFNSAKLLLLSGLGPKNQLISKGIKVIKDLPVGQTMYDNIQHFGPTFVTNTIGQSIDFSGAAALKAFKLLSSGQGPLTSTGGNEALTFVRFENSQQPIGVPDVELTFFSGSFHSDGGNGLRQTIRMTDEIYNTVYLPLLGQDAFTIYVKLFNSSSVGSLELLDANPESSPVINSNYLADSADVERILLGIKEAIRIAQMPAFQALGATLHNIPLPNCIQYVFGSDDYWRCSIRTLSSSLYNQVGTCRMGTSSDPLAVVSPSLKVRGIKRLRVADASVIPTPTTGYTTSVGYMIGEKLADRIIYDWVGRRDTDISNEDDE